MSLDTARTKATLIVSYDKLSRILIAGHCRCTFFGHATPDRAGARPYRVQCRVARCDMGLPAHTSHPLSRLFACFASPIPQAKRGRDRNSIPDRSSCPLRPSVHLLFLHWVPVGDGFPEAKRDASPPWTSRTLRASHSSLQARQHADTASFVVALPSRHSWLLPFRQ